MQQPEISIHPLIGRLRSLVYQIMTFVYLFVAFVFALLHIEAWIIGVIFGLFLLQTFLGIVLYKHFEKHF